MTFTIPVNPDGNHIGYPVTVTVSVIHTVPKQITVKVKSSSRPLPRPIPLLPITHFYIRVTEADYTRHLYEYRNGRVDER